MRWAVLRRSKAVYFSRDELVRSQHLSHVEQAVVMLYPIILSGGSGTRLWPLSREHYPKQLLALAGPGATMLQAGDATSHGWGRWVIPPFLVRLRSRHHAAMASRCFGVIPPKAMFGRS